MTLAVTQTERGVIVAFAPSQLDVWTDDGAVADNNRVHVRTARDALKASKALAVMDGAMFLAASYKPGTVGRLTYRLLARDGMEHDGGSATDTRGCTINVVRGEHGEYVETRDGDDVHDDATVAVQLYPTLVRRGVVVASDTVNRDRNWRAALCYLRTGQLAFAVGKASMHAFAQWLAECGALDASYADGGGSTKIALSDGRVFGSTEDRAVATWLAVRP